MLEAETFVIVDEMNIAKTDIFYGCCIQSHQNAAAAAAAGYSLAKKDTSKALKSLTCLKIS